MKLLATLANMVVAQGHQESASGAGSLGSIMGMLPIVAMFAVIYFLLIRPANKQRKEHAAMLGALKKDDDVVTTGGLCGRIASIDDKVAVLEVADRVKIRVLRDRIAGKWPADSKMLS